MRMDVYHKDFNLQMLKSVIDSLDQQLIALHKLIRQSLNPDDEDLLTRFDYISGYGFVAMQQFMAEVISKTGSWEMARLSKKSAFEFGPCHKDGLTVASLINNGANYWKHEPDWWNPNNEMRTLINPDKNGQKTIEKVWGVVESSSYPLANMLYGLVEKDNFLLSDLLPLIDQWANDVLEYAHHQKNQQGESC